MTSYASPSSFSTPHTGTQSTTIPTSAVPADLSPSSLDTLPVLSSILTRLQTASPTTTAPNPSASPNPQAQSQHAYSQPQSQSQPTSSQPQSQTQQSSSATAPSSSHTQPRNHNNTFATTPLAPKDIPAETDTLKHRLQKVRALVAGLPDMDRSVHEQEVEIAELEERIRLQRDVLERLRALGAGGEKMVEG